MNKYKPVSITQNFYKLGTPAFPVYLSIGNEGMIIEGGISGIYPLVTEQIKELGISPEKIKYLALTHTHADHVGMVPYLKTLWPHLKIVGSQKAADSLKKEVTIKSVVFMNRTLTGIALRKGEITSEVPDPASYEYSVDIVVGDNDKIDLGNGIVWTVIETPGHSPCHTSYYEDKDSVLTIGDATGFFNPRKDVFWPNYFESLEKYCNSIRKLSMVPATIGALSHNCLVQGDIKQYLSRAIKATEAYHHEVIVNLEYGRTVEELAQETAKWVNTLTDDHPYEIMYSLAKTLIKHSCNERHKKNLFYIIQNGSTLSYSLVDSAGQLE